MSTANDIIRLALKDIGALGTGQSPLPEDSNDALLTLNQMIAQWNKKRWMVYHLVEQAFISTGAQTYTIGPGGNFPVAKRPDQINAAFFRSLLLSSSNQVDYPMQVLTSREDYSRITLKKMTSFPEYLFYDAVFPTGILFPWPILQATIYELHIVYKDSLASFPTLATAFALPEEYEMALRYNLAVKMAPSYGADVPQDVRALAREGREVIRGANFAISTLQMPIGINRPGGYSIFSDDTR